MGKFNNGKKVLVEALILGKKSESEIICSIEGTRFCLQEDRIQEKQDKTYKDGLNDAWEIAKKLVCYESTGGLPSSQLEEIFGTSDSDDIVTCHTAQEAAEKIAEWEKKEIHVGDVVKDKIMKNGYAVVTNINRGTNCYVIWEDGSCGECEKNDLTKTGRTIDISELLAQIGGIGNE